MLATDELVEKVYTAMALANDANLDLQRAGEKFIQAARRLQVGIPIDGTYHLNQFTMIKDRVRKLDALLTQLTAPPKGRKK